MRAYTRVPPTPLYDARITMDRQYFAYAMKGCPDSTIAGPNNVITNQVSLKSEA